MVDLTDLAQSYTVEQLFRFDVGDGAADGWTTLPSAAAQIAVRRAAGVDDSDRVVITFADRAIQNQWLRVTVLEGTTSGLAAPDVFHFGHLHGDAGPSPLRVDALDLAAVRRAAGRPATIADSVDFNRDGRVDALDVAVTRQNVAGSLMARSTQTEVSPAATAAQNDLRRASSRRSVWDGLV